jgi:hypothetical protein
VGRVPVREAALPLEASAGSSQELDLVVVAGLLVLPAPIQVVQNLPNYKPLVKRPIMALLPYHTCDKSSSDLMHEF